MTIDPSALNDEFNCGEEHLCECGCGLRTNANPRKKGAYRRFVCGHSNSRIRNNVNVLENGCHEWTGARTPTGYGILTVNRQKVRAHRFFYERHFGPIPMGLVVMHSCDNPWCVNPDHLSVGTDADNMRDREEKGRGALKIQSHCTLGHAYTPTNTRVDRKNGKRFCRECAKLNMRKFRSRNRHKDRCRSRLIAAVKRGDVIKPLHCEECGRIELLCAHHHDYSKPLEVRWLCRSCHVGVHGGHYDPSRASSSAAGV